MKKVNRTLTSADVEKVIRIAAVTLNAVQQIYNISTCKANRNSHSKHHR